MHEIFEQRNIQYNLSSQTDFQLGSVKTVKFCKNQYLPTHFHIYVPKLANGIYRGLVSCSYIQTIQ